MRTNKKEEAHFAGWQEMDKWYFEPRRYSALVKYWKVYGGFLELVRSPYLAFSVLGTIAMAPIWWKNPSGTFAWTSISLSILPSMLGFSLGAIAILISFSDARLSKIIHKARGRASYYLSVIAIFFHFTIIQCLGILLSLFLVAYPNRVLSGFAFFFLLYAVFSAIASVAALFGLAGIVDHSRRMASQKEEDSSDLIPKNRK